MTLVVTSLFIGLFSQMYLAMERQRVTVAGRAVASDIAFTNLRKFAIRTPLMNDKALCDPATMDITSANAQDKAGLTLGDETNGTVTSIFGFMSETGEAVARLEKPVKQTVLAYATQGCDDDNFIDYPLMIVSKVQYGKNDEVVSHASYVK
ncbi:MAG: hypothetical protein EOO17_03735 [Chloroflexi bacterium]|nr:MAG: hypothetical protein EOO17_03735 [Chloroflexota bacterium]